MIGQKRLVFVSGMYSSELHSVMSAYNDSGARVSLAGTCSSRLQALSGRVCARAGLPRCVWAALVPANVDTVVDQLVSDVYGETRQQIVEHLSERLTGRRSAGDHYHMQRQAQASPG